MKVYDVVIAFSDESGLPPIHLSVPKSSWFGLSDVFLDYVVDRDDIKYFTVTSKEV